MIYPSCNSCILTHTVTNLHCSVSSFDATSLQLSILHTRVVYSSRPRCQKAFNCPCFTFGATSPPPQDLSAPITDLTDSNTRSSGTGHRLPSNSHGAGLELTCCHWELGKHLTALVWIVSRGGFSLNIWSLFPPWMTHSIFPKRKSFSQNKR